MLLTFMFFPPPLLCSLGLTQGVGSRKPSSSNPSLSSFLSSWIGGKGCGNLAKPGTLGNGIKELRRGAGATGIRCNIGQRETLPVRFAGGSGCSAILGLFSFSVGSLCLTMPSSDGSL